MLSKSIEGQLILALFQINPMASLNFIVIIYIFDLSKPLKDCTVTSLKTARLKLYFRCIAHNSFGIYVRTYRLNIKLDEKPLEAIDQLVPGGVPSISQPGINSNPQNSDTLANPEVF